MKSSCKAHESASVVMSWFSQKKSPEPYVKSSLGRFTFQETAWMTQPAEGSLVVLASGNELDTRAIDRAQSLLLEIDAYKQRAVDYAKTHGANVWDGKGGLTLEALDITDILNNKVGLTFGVEGRPDFTLTVEFLDGSPQLVWGAD